ncbi:cysteine desulfurase [Saprospiraceae bacterium]|nr:cysteine desulfurase [Saprospiraceae bacterium]
MIIYFDNASTTPLLKEVKEIMISTLNDNYGNPSSIHRKGREAKIVIEDARKTIAGLLGASTGEIFFTSGATESNNMSLLCSIRDLGVNHIISSPTEHHCILHTLNHIEENNLAKVSYLDVDKDGHISYTQLEELLAANEGKQMVSLMHVNNELGTIHDIKLIADICTKNDALFNCDTSQSMGKMPINVQDVNVNFLCGSAHKFFAPKGVGFIYIKNENMIKPLVYGGDQERGIRSGTENIYSIAAMSKALEIAHQEMDVRKAIISKLRTYFVNKAKEELEDVIINGSQHQCAYNILSVSFPHTEKSDLLMMNLDISGICASSGSACSSGVENDSHVLHAIGHDPSRKTVRFSFSHFNTKDEVDYTIETLKKYTPIKEPSE